MIELRGVKKRFGSQVVLDGVDFDVKEGETVALMGPSGCGKSVLLKHIIGLIKPDAGTVHFNGHDITGAPPRARCIAGIGRSFQIPHPFENMTVFENLLVAAIHGSRQREADVVDACGDILERTGLIGFANRQAGKILQPSAYGVCP